MDELLPVLVARVTNKDDAVPAIEAALRCGIAFLALDEPPSCEGPHALELHVPDWTEPVLLTAEPAGDPLGREHPLSLRPFAPEHVEVLVALLAEAGVTFVPAAPAEPPPISLDDPPLIDLDLRLSDPPPAEIELSDDLDLDLHLTDPPPAPAPGQLAGRTLGGKYLVEKLLGSGAMGDVYQATHLALRKAIAVKVLHPSHRHNAEFIAAFQREALAASRLDHPNVVQVMDFGHEPDGMLYLVMELLSGSDLRAVLDQQPVQPLARIVDVMSQVAAALSASHDQNVVHRDVKPDNIILVPKRDDDGTVRDVVKVCDFGIAEMVERGADGAAQKREVAGTPDYMAPEQVRGGDIDARTDLYACGVILYEMATGKVPFDAEDSPLHIAWAHVRKEPPPPSARAPGIDKRLEALILKAMSKDPARRHQSARDLRAELRALLEKPRVEPAAPLARPDPSPQAPVSIRRPSFDDEDIVPRAHAMRFDRSDAIDIGDFLVQGETRAAAPDAASEQQWAEAEQMATALILSPAPVLKQLDAVAQLDAYARTMATLERALFSVATRGAAAPLLAALTHLTERARGAAPSSRSREGLAAGAVAAVAAKPGPLLRIAREALDGEPAARDAARKVLLMLGDSGARALTSARAQGAPKGPGWPGRARFVAVMREIGVAAVYAIEAAAQHTDANDAALLEDLLRAMPDLPKPIPDPAHERLGTLLSSTFLRHGSIVVRRLAAAALAAVWGPRANAWLAPLLEDPDDGLRIAALAGMRRHAGIDRDVVQRIERILQGATPAGTDLRVAAAAALRDATAPARGAAVDVLTQALRPAGGGFLSKLVTAVSIDDPPVLATMAQVLVALAGPDGARVVEARAAKSSGEVKQRLMDVLGRGGR